MTRPTNRTSPHRFAAFAFAAAVLASAGSANAGKIADLTSGAWTGGAFTNAHTGSFSHCAVNAKYKSGVALYFAVTGTRQWSMGFASDTWSFQRGHKYPVRYQVDNGPVIQATAVAKSTALVQVHLPVNGRVFSRFQAGNTLRVATGRTVMQFALTGAGPMLMKLVQCASHHADKAGARPHSSSRRGNTPAAHAPRARLIDVAF